MKWPHAAAKTRDSISDALSTGLPALVKDRPGRPDVESLRTALRKYALLPESKRPAAPRDAARVIRWLEGASLDLAILGQAKTVRLALDAIALRLDGKAASANTIRRKRAVLHALLEYAVELEHSTGRTTLSRGPSNSAVEGPHPFPALGRRSSWSRSALAGGVEASGAIRGLGGHVPGVRSSGS
ncbi:hypothetical protein [Nonomuraea sp. NPDC049725]|uniref:hypothetical protein n=1 Tax=Nonomuraea sp. NPDC049725 TaxID=3154508 RepID=UPI0034385861